MRCRRLGLVLLLGWASFAFAGVVPMSASPTARLAAADPPTEQSASLPPRVQTSMADAGAASGAAPGRLTTEDGTPVSLQWDGASGPVAIQGDPAASAELLDRLGWFDLSTSQQRAALMLGILAFISAVMAGLVFWRYRRQSKVGWVAEPNLQVSKASVMAPEAADPDIPLLDADDDPADNALAASQPEPRRRRRIRYRRHRLPNL